MLDNNVLANEDIKKMENEIQMELDEAIKFAEDSPYPEVDVMFEYIYVSTRKKEI